MNRVIFLISALLLSFTAFAECIPSGFGPNPNSCIDPAPQVPLDRPTDMCFPDGCRPIVYAESGRFVVAKSELPNGFEVLGYAGPCHVADLMQCPAIYRQAAERMRVDAEQQNRAQGYLLLPQ